MALHEVQEKLIGFYIDGLRGDRLGPLGFAEQIVSGDWPPFAKICAALTLPFLGYRRPAIKEFSGIHGTVRALASEVATVAQFLACLEYGFKTCDYEIMYTAKKSAHKNGIDKKPINILWADYHERKLSAKFMYKITGLAKNMFSR